MKIKDDSILNNIHLLVLGLIGLIGTGYITYNDVETWRHNGCSEETLGIIEQVGQNYIEIRINGDLLRRKENERLTSFFENGQEVLLSYCTETGVILIYNFDKWTPNWLIVLRAILGVFFSLLIISGLSKKVKDPTFLD